MSFRFMRSLVFFDLPVETLEEKRVYRSFRKMLIKNGFVMLQESVYCKLMTSPSVESSIQNMLQTNKPTKGVVMNLTVTEKQFCKMQLITGSFHTDVVDSEKAVIVL